MENFQSGNIYSFPTVRQTGYEKSPKMWRQMHDLERKKIEQARNAHVVSVQVKLTQRKFADQEIPAASREGVALSLGIAPELFGTS